MRQRGSSLLSSPNPDLLYVVQFQQTISNALLKSLQERNIPNWRRKQQPWSIEPGWGENNGQRERWGSHESVVKRGHPRGATGRASESCRPIRGGTTKTGHLKEGPPVDHPGPSIRGNPTSWTALENMIGKCVGRNLGNVWNERKKGSKRVAKDFVCRLETCMWRKPGVCATQRFIKHGSTANLEKRFVKRIHAVMEHGHGVMWRFRKPGNTTAVFVFFAIVFSLYSLNNCRVRALLDSLLF